MTLETWNRHDSQEYGLYLKADNGAVVMWSHQYNTPQARDTAARRLAVQLRVNLVRAAEPKNPCQFCGAAKRIASARCPKCNDLPR